MFDRSSGLTGARKTTCAVTATARWERICGGDQEMSMARRPPHILVIDDDAVVGKYIALHLRRQKYRVSRAVNGAEGEAVIAADVPDLIILDHYLPDTTGDALLDSLRQGEATHAIPVIYLTVDGSRQRFRKSMVGGADDFLAKPFEAQELVDAVNAQLRKSYSRMMVNDDAARPSDDDEIARLVQEMRALESRLALAYEERRSTQLELTMLNATIEHRVAEKTLTLVRQNAALKSYSHAVAHELRRPLRGILGFTGLLMDTQPSEAQGESARLLANIEKSGRRMNEFIEGLLALAQAENREIHRSRVDLSVMAEDVVAHLTAATAKLTVQTRIASGLAADTDPVLARIVLENLLANAQKYSAKNAAPAIEFGVCEINGESVFFVRDNGAGFDMQDADRLFEPFQRLHSTADYDGLGIGLATAQQIIERHHGRIWAKGAPGEGATFFFTLQRAN